MLSANEFELLVPWYVNGTLSDSERALVVDYLATHPEEHARVQWNASMRAAVKRQADELLANLESDLASSISVRSKAPAHSGVDEDVETVSHSPDDTAVTAAPGGETKQLLQRVKKGYPGASDALFARAYGELKRLAHVRLYQSGRDEMLDTTALVHEAYLRFIQSAELRPEDRRSFFAFASQVMRNVIVDTARARLAQPRGGHAAELSLSTQLLDHLSSGEEAILDVHEALLVLEQADPRLAQVAQMRYFGGYSEREIAETLGVTERTVQRDWNKARLLLKAALQRR